MSRISAKFSMIYLDSPMKMLLSFVWSPSLKFEGILHFGAHEVECSKHEEILDEFGDLLVDFRPSVGKLKRCSLTSSCFS